MAGLAAVATIAAAGVGGPGLGKPALAAFARPPSVAAVRPGGSCDQVSGAYQLPGADGVTPAAWTGDGLTVPACGPIPNDGGLTNPVYPYPGALRTPGYQCVEFSERYLYYRYGVTMSSSTNGDQVAAHYAAAYPALFMIVRNGTPHRAPVPGDVLSMSTLPSFDSVAGGHTVVVQSSSVNAAGDGTLTVVEENAVASGIQVLPVADWSVTYHGFPYLEWLTTVGLIDAFSYDATAGSLRDARWTGTRWVFTTIDGSGSTLAGHTSDDVGTVASAVEIDGQPMVFYSDTTTGSLRAAWRSGAGWRFETLDGPGSTGPGHTADHVGSAVSAVLVAGRPEVFYDDASDASLRLARQTADGWQLETLDGPGSVLYQHTWHHVGSALSALVADGAPQVFYYDATAGTLHRAWWNGARWLFLTIDGAGAPTAGHTGDRVGSALSATPLGGQPEVFYDDASDASLRYARLTASGWRYQTLDGSGSALPGHSADGVGSAVAVTRLNGNAQVFYDDATRQSLRHAFWTGTAWVLETLDGPGSVIPGHDADQVGSSVSAIAMPGGPQVYYADATAGSLRHTWWTPSGWRFETLDGPGSVIAGHTAVRVGSGVAVTLS